MPIRTPVEREDRFNMSKKKRHQTDSVKAPPEDAQSRKRARHYTEDDAALAGVFEQLAHDDKDVRLKAAAELVRKIGPESKPDGDLISKVLTRLIKGLCSGRKAARFGFFVALTEVLRLLFGAERARPAENELSLDDVVDTMIKNVKVDGKVAGQVQ